MSQFHENPCKKSIKQREEKCQKSLSPEQQQQQQQHSSNHNWEMPSKWNCAHSAAIKPELAEISPAAKGRFKVYRARIECPFIGNNGFRTLLKWLLCKNCFHLARPLYPSQLFANCAVFYETSAKGAQQTLHFSTLLIFQILSWRRGLCPT